MVLLQQLICECGFYHSVWPEVGIKSVPNLSNSCTKRRHNRFHLKSNVFKNPKLSNIWATYVTNFVPKSFKTLPNLVTHTIIILIQPLKWFFAYLATPSPLPSPLPVSSSYESGTLELEAWKEIRKCYVQIINLFIPNCIFNQLHKHKTKSYLGVAIWLVF